MRTKARRWRLATRMGRESVWPLGVACVCVIMCTVWHARVTLATLTSGLQADMATWQVGMVAACEHAARALEVWRAWPQILVPSVVNAAATAAESGVHSLGHAVLSMYVDVADAGCK